MITSEYKTLMGQTFCTQIKLPFIESKLKAWFGPHEYLITALVLFVTPNSKIVWQKGNLICCTTSQICKLLSKTRKLVWWRSLNARYWQKFNILRSKQQEDVHGNSSKTAAPHTRKECRTQGCLLLYCNSKCMFWEEAPTRVIELGRFLSISDVCVLAL